MSNAAASPAKPSPEQERIYSFIAGSESNLIVQACAGSGKTTTLRGICERLLALPRPPRILALAFNKLNAEAFKAKLPPGVHSATVHSTALKILNGLGKQLVEPDKKYTLARKLWGRSWNSVGSTEQAYGALALKLADFARSTMTDLTNTHAAQVMVDAYEIDITHPIVEIDEDVLFRKAADFLAAARAERSVIDYDDMVDHVLHYNVAPKETYDYILGDEVQDWNKQQATFIAHLCRRPNDLVHVSTGFEDLLDDLPAFAPVKAHRGARVVLVGDIRQSIYSWRGADPGSMPALEHRFECETLPLSVCYRCPVKVIELAQDIVGEDVIKPRDGAPEGEVIMRADHEVKLTEQELQPGDLVLSRVNRPLVPWALRLIRQGRPAFVRGVDVGKRIVTLVTKSLTKCSQVSMPDYRIDLSNYVFDLISELWRNEKTSAAATLFDMYGCILDLSEDAATPHDIAGVVTVLFKDAEADGRSVVFSSVHRAKGLEAERVVILGFDMMPHPMAQSDRQLTEELNIKYVAITRSQQRLVLQDLGKTTPKDQPTRGQLRAMAEARNAKKDTV